MTTFGSYGDLNPYLAMGKVLQSHGHVITLATHAEYREQVERLGFRFVPVKPGLDDLGPQEDWAAKANHSLFGTEFIVRTLILPYLNDGYATLRQAAEGQDLMIAHLLTFAAPLIAEELKIPWLSTALQPSVFFSAYDPPTLGFLTILPRLKFLGPSFMGWFLKQLARPTNSWLKPLSDLRAKIGLPPSSRNALVDGFSPYGTLTLFPPAFSAPQPDWPSGVTQIGFPLFDEELTKEISPGLKDFLEAGPPPVVFTLGTAIVRMETNYFEVAYEAVRELSLRAVFLVGKTPRRVPQAAYSDLNVHISGYEPFSGLFPYAAANVHQCGIGTTSQALAAGRPQIMVPFAHDQPDNARRLAKLGVGHTIPARRLNVRRLVEALTLVTKDRRYLERASQLVPELQLAGFDQRLTDAVSTLLNR